MDDRTAKAVPTQSPGLLQPWESAISRFNRNAVAPPVATRSGLLKALDFPQG